MTRFWRDDVRAALRAHQRTANAQAARWVEGELRREFLFEPPAPLVVPCSVNGVRHDPDCSTLHTPANRVLRSPCNCGAA